MKKYHCDYENCKYASSSRSGDGWNEPYEYEFYCEKEDDLIDDDAEWTDNPNDETCLEFKDK